jgi:hypothetical protein
MDAGEGQRGRIKFKSDHRARQKASPREPLPQRYLAGVGRVGLKAEKPFREALAVASMW